MYKYGFYVSGNATRLKNFITFLVEQDRSDILSSIKIVISDNPNDIELKELLNNHKIIIVFCNLTNYKNKNFELSNIINLMFCNQKVDYGFVFGNRILEGELLENYKNKLINFHPSVLPSHKGQKAIDKAIEDKAFLLGNTAHIIVEAVDSGPIIIQNIIHVSKFVDYETLLNNQIFMLLNIIKWIEEERIMLSNQTVLIDRANYNSAEYIPSLEI